MAISIYLKKQNNQLVPADKYAQEKIEGLKEGKWHKAKIGQVRYLPFHSKYWVLLGEIVENSDIYHLKAKEQAIQELHISIKYGIGYVEKVEVVSGEEKVYYNIPKSTDFATMDNLEFEDYYNSAMDWLRTQSQLNTEGIV